MSEDEVTTPERLVMLTKRSFAVMLLKRLSGGLAGVLVDEDEHRFVVHFPVLGGNVKMTIDLDETRPGGIPIQEVDGFTNLKQQRELLMVLAGHTAWEQQEGTMRNRILGIAKEMEEAGYESLPRSLRDHVDWLDQEGRTE